MTGGQFIEHDSEGPEIGARLSRLAAQDFGRYIRQSSADAGCPLQCGKGQGRRIEGAAPDALGKSKIENFDQAVRSGDDIGSFQVTMDNAAIMRAREGAGDLNS